MNICWWEKNGLRSSYVLGLCCGFTTIATVSQAAKTGSNPVGDATRQFPSSRFLDAFRPIAKNYFVVDTMRFMLKKDIISPRELLERTIKELGKGENPPFLDCGYSSGYASFFPTGLNVVAYSGQYLICESTRSEGGLKNYLNSLEVVEETIDYVLAQPDPENWRLGWSS